jgi:hypothetical protein
MSNLSELIPAGSGQNNIDFVADGAITSGKPVILNSAGTVTEAGESSTVISTDYIAGSADASVHKWATAPSIAWDSADTDKFLAITEYGDVIYGIVGTVSGSGASTSISLGTPISITSSGYLIKGFTADPNNAGKFVITYEGASTTGMVVAVVFSGATGLTIGTPQEFDSTVQTGENYYSGICADPNVENQYIIQWREPAGTKDGMARVMTLASGSGTTMTFGTAMTWYDPSSSEIGDPAIIASPQDSGLFVVIYRDPANSQYGTARCLSLSGTTITSNTATVFMSNGAVLAQNGAFNPDVSGEFLTVYGGYGAGGYAARQMQAKVGTLNTSTKALTFGSVVTTNLGSGGESVQAPARLCAMGVSSNAFLMNYLISNGGLGGYILQIIGTISSGVVSFGTRNTTYGSGVENSGSGSGPDCAADPNNGGRAVSVFIDSLRLSGNDTRTFVTEVGGTYTATNLTATNLLGIASAAILDTATGTINTWGSRNEVQTSLTIGSDYYVQNDGTITTASSGPAQLIGTAITATQINIKDYTG